MSSTSSSAFAVNCPSCGLRLRFALDPAGPPRIRLRCATCGTEFGVRRPGTAPLSSATGAASVSSAAGAASVTVAGTLLTATAAPAGTAGVSLAGLPLTTASSVPPGPPPGVGAGGLAQAVGAAGSPSAVSAAIAGEAATAPSGTPLEAAPSSLRPQVFAAGEIVAGRYRIVRFLAQGGMGEVYEVEDLELHEPVALKTVRPDAGADSLAVERFRREIQLARKVTHPNVCRIFDVSHHRPPGAGQPIIFLTMELLAGVTLAERLRRGGPLAAPEALPIARQICAALAAAHQVGIVHRDLKPGNVVLVPARTGIRAVVTDFGLARLAAGHDPGALTLTTAGGLVGTPAYLAPEQLEGGEITTAVDIYALGIVLYEMATGTVPFLGDSVLATAVKRLRETPASPRVHAPHLDARWETTILRCLERDPAARFASPLEVAAALDGEPPADGGQSSGSGPAAAASGTLLAASSGAPIPYAGAPPNAPGALHAAGAAPQVAGDSFGGAGRAADPSGPTLAGGSLSPGGSDGAARTGSLPGSAWTGSLGAGVAGSPSSSSGETGDPRAGGAGATLAAAAESGAAAEGEAPPASTRDSRPSRRLLTFALVALIVASVAVAAYRVSGWRAARAAAERRLGLPSAEVTPRRAVAVLGFRDLSASPASAWLSPALAEMLSTELGAGGALRIAAGEDVARVKLEMQLGQPDSLSRDTLARLRTLLGTDVVVAGSYLVVGSPGSRQIRLDVRLADAATGETTTTFSETGTEAGLFQLVSQAGERLRRSLHAAAAPAAVRALAANPEAARLYSEGLQKLRLFDPVAARDLLVQAVQADPASAPAHEALAAAWAALGYDAKARDEAKTALDLAGGLPAEERLLIEGRYREATGEWGAAADLYRRLVALYPDSPDYGLRLAAAEIAAGRPEDALATTAALRTLPAPARDDPRIDLAEATAAGATSAFERQHTTAVRAAERAAALGASLLVAQARLLDCSALRNLGRADDALAACAEGRRLSAAAGDRSGVAEALTNAANVHFDRGRLAEAQGLYEQALATYRETGNRGAEGRALNNIAVVLRSQGDLERARQLFEQVLAIAREIGSRGAEAYALNNLAGVLLRRGDLDGAAALYRQSLAIRRELKDAAGEAYELDNLGVALRRRGNLEGAQRQHEQALAIRRRIGQKIGEVASLNNLGSLLFDRGDLNGALASFQQALAASRAIGSQTSTAHALFGLGEVQACRGQLDEARRNHQAALGLRLTLGEKGTAAESRLALAELDLTTAEAATGAPSIAAYPAIAAQAEAVATDLANQGAADQQARALSLAAVAAHAAGQEPRAQADIERATALLQAAVPLAPPATANPLAQVPPGSPAAPAVLGAVQDLRVRLLVELRAAALLPPAQDAKAQAALATVRDEAARTGLLELQLDAKLVLADRAEHARNTFPATTRSLAAALAAEARAHGFDLLAAQAAALSTLPAGR
jgi:tetratricopeptide (TPR) repeat protein/TolB-like protein